VPSPVETSYSGSALTGAVSPWPGAVDVLRPRQERSRRAGRRRQRSPRSGMARWWGDPEGLLALPAGFSYRCDGGVG